MIASTYTQIRCVLVLLLLLCESPTSTLRMDIFLGNQETGAMLLSATIFVKSKKN